MSTSEQQIKIAYIGPAGAGFGFQLSGIGVYEETSSEAALDRVRRLKAGGEYGIIFIDESLAETVRESLTKLNEDPLPAIILLPNPVAPQRVAAHQLQQLMVRAIGSDIFQDT